MGSLKMMISLKPRRTSGYISNPDDVATHFPCPQINNHFIGLQSESPSGQHAKNKYADVNLIKGSHN